MASMDEDALQRYDENGCRLVVGCIPYKVTKKNQLKILMVRSQSGKDLVFPKGGWEQNETNQEAAAREAQEEAGVVGSVGEPLGKWKFHKSKRCWDINPTGACLIEIFPLKVTEQLKSWPEQHRERKWINVQRFLYHDKIQLPRTDWIRESLDKFIRLKMPQQQHPGLCLHRPKTCMTAAAVPLDSKRPEAEDEASAEATTTSAATAAAAAAPCADTRNCRHTIASAEPALCCSVTALVP